MKKKRIHHHTANKIRQLFAKPKQVHSEPSESDTGDEGDGAQPPTESPESEVPETEYSSNSPKNEKNHADRPRWTDQRWQTVFMGLILLVTAIYATVSFFQWRTMELALRISEKNLQSSEKAYIVISDIQPDFKNGKIRVQLENIGHVPAGQVDIRVDVERDAKDAPPRELPLEWNSYKFATMFSQIAPGGIKTIIDVPLQSFTQEDANLISAGKQTLYLSFWLTYDNGFDGSDPKGFMSGATETTFEFRYVPPPNERWENVRVYTNEDIRKRHEDERKQEAAKSPSPN